MGKKRQIDQPRGPQQGRAKGQAQMRPAVWQPRVQEAEKMAAAEYAMAALPKAKLFWSRAKTLQRDSVTQFRLN